MINLFRKLNPANLILLVIISLLLRLGIFVHLPESLRVNFMEPFTRLMLDIPQEGILSPAANVLLALALVILQSMIFNRIVTNHNLLGKPSFLPALLFVTLSSLFEPYLILNPPLICNFLSIWMVDKFLNIYRNDSASSSMYDLGMIVAVGTLIYFPFIAMFPLLWISLLIFRPFNWREWVAALIGFATIYFFLAVYYYWNDSLAKFYNIWLPLGNSFPANIRINLYDYMVLIPVAFILALSALALQQNFFRSFVQIRKAFQLLFFMLILALISFYIMPQFRIHHFLLAVAPGSVFMAYYFLHAKKRWFYESVYLIFAGVIIYLGFF